MFSAFFEEKKIATLSYSFEVLSNFTDCFEYRSASLQINLSQQQICADL